MTAARVHERFAEWAERTPSAIAVIDGASTLSYREVDERAERLASGLLARGIGPGKLVGLALPRGADVVVAMIGILKSGAAYVPLDPMYPRDRLDFMLADSGVDTVVAPRDRGGHGAASGGWASSRSTRQPAASAVASARPRAAHAARAILGDLAYVIYTSGSTGTPKGVVVTHAQRRAALRRDRHWFGFGATDVWTLFHSYAFDFSVWEIWGALLHGGRLVVVPYRVSRSPAAVPRAAGAESGSRCSTRRRRRSAS